MTHRRWSREDFWHSEQEVRARTDRASYPSATRVGRSLALRVDKQCTATVSEIVGRFAAAIYEATLGAGQFADHRYIHSYVGQGISFVRRAVTPAPVGEISAWYYAEKKRIDAHQLGHDATIGAWFSSTAGNSLGMR
jgi:hypothetical protein